MSLLECVALRTLGTGEGVRPGSSTSCPGTGSRAGQGDIEKQNNNRPVCRAFTELIRHRRDACVCVCVFHCGSCNFVLSHTPTNQTMARLCSAWYYLTSIVAFVLVVNVRVWPFITHPHVFFVVFLPNISGTF